MGWKTFRDRIALFVVVGMPIIWLLTGTTSIAMPEAALGATIMGWTLAIQFYFRKKEGGE